MTSGFFWTSTGGPSAILRPKSSTTTLSETCMTSPMWCSTSRTVTPRAAVDADHDVLEHGQRREEGEVLERPPDAELRDPMGRQPEDRTAVEADITLVGRGEAAQAVEERRLAGAVRADEADDLPRVHVEGDGVEREDAAEADGEVTNGQDWHREIRSVYGTRTRKTKKPRPPCLPELEEVAVPHREIEVLDPDPAATAGRQVVHARAVEHDGLSRQPRERSNAAERSPERVALRGLEVDCDRATLARPAGHEP